MLPHKRKGVTGKAGVSRGAQPGPGFAPIQANPEWVGGSQAVSRSNAAGRPRYEPGQTPVSGVLPQIQGNNTGTQGNGSRHREKKQPLPFDELFSTKKFARFYSIKLIGEADLTRLNLFKVDITVTSLIGRCNRILENFATKTWTVEVKFDQQGQTLGRMSVLLSELVQVIPPWTSQPVPEGCYQWIVGALYRGGYSGRPFSTWRHQMQADYSQPTISTPRANCH